MQMISFIETSYLTLPSTVAWLQGQRKRAVPLPHDLRHARTRYVGAAGFKQRARELRVARIEPKQAAVNGGQQRHLLSVQMVQVAV